MENKTKPELIFWFDAPPRAGAGVFRHVANHWNEKVCFLCAKPLREERKAGGWQECNLGKATIITLSEQENIDQYLKSFLKEHPNAIHICNGLRSLTSPYIKKHIFTQRNPQVALWSERPGIYGGKVKKIERWVGLPLIHRYYALRYKNAVKVFLPLGTSGVEAFATYGWERKKLFPFMYDPGEKSNISTFEKRFAEAGCLKMLYVGRFSKSTKGLDVLISAINRLTGDKWHLDLVGGYGELKDYALNWAEQHSNVSFCGTWLSSEVSQRMAGYDICIIPSRFDGWNVVANEALRAGIGVIITDSAASDDLIRASGAGKIVPAGNADALRAAIQQVIDDPMIAESWKERAKAYSHRISSETVGRYLMDVLEYTFIDPTLPRPECPWL